MKEIIGREYVDIWGKEEKIKEWKKESGWRNRRIR
jgi:hypothetical protein